MIAFYRTHERVSWDLTEVLDLDWRDIQIDALTPTDIDVVETALLVESNNPDYVMELLQFFKADTDVCDFLMMWGIEEWKHYYALYDYLTKVRVALCSRCGLVARVGKRFGEQSVCMSCWQRDPALLRICARCGATAKAAANVEGRYFCQLCYERTTAKSSRSWSISWSMLAKNFLMSHFNIQQVLVLFLETLQEKSRNLFTALCVPLFLRQEYESWMNLLSKYS